MLYPQTFRLKMSMVYDCLKLDLSYRHTSLLTTTVTASTHDPQQAVAAVHIFILVCIFLNGRRPSDSSVTHI